jgi:hypothetical protein
MGPRAGQARNALPIAEPLVIEVQELRTVTEWLLDAAEERFGSSLELDADDYWTLDHDNDMRVRLLGRDEPGADADG